MIYGDASTFSKMHCNYPDNVDKYICSANGQYIETENHHKLFDTVSSLGAQLFEHESDCIQSLPYIGELELAERITEVLPFVDMIRLGCNGADATEGAIRYAREYTGRDYVLSVGYHSCQSSFTYNTNPALGCIDGLILQLDSFEELINELEEEHFVYSGNVAAVIIEPIMLDICVDGYLHEIRRITREKGIVLIFDEIVTGLRVPKHCVSKWLGIFPDLVLFGKAFGGGYPISIIGGKKDIMNRPVFHSYTFAGFPRAVDNAIKALSITEDTLRIFWAKSGFFFGKFNELFKHKFELFGYQTRAVWKSKLENGVAILQQEMYKRGFLIGPCYFPRITWNTGDYEMLFDNASDVINNIINGKLKLEGRSPHGIFDRNK